MKRILSSALFVLAVACGSVCFGQPPAPPHARDFGAEDPANGQTPSMSSDVWLYVQEQRRHDDPKEAVRRKAEFKADQRARRLATMKWFGYSNLRPQASTIPIMGVYSPTWTGNHTSPYRWVGSSGYSYPSTAIIIEHVPSRR